ncbi:MAG: hypothetical protein IPO91_32745 [Chloroflexi bacterium]|nr:hypothetical protein [Chloroflexota bacterium]
MLPVAADTVASSYSASCSGLSATGTSNAPYVVLWVQGYNAAGDWLEYNQAFANPTGTYIIGFNFPAFETGSFLEYYVWGSPTSDPNDWDAEDYFELDTACTPTVPGPSAPSSFVLHTITCDVPVYNAPGGEPISGATIRTGQTWYVSPTPVSGSDGESWTEIFNAGWTNGFIPTSCVG